MQESNISIYCNGKLTLGLPQTEEGLLLHTLACAALFDAPGTRLSKICRVKLPPFSSFENDILRMY
jgi:hypothetical protein